MAVAFPVDGVLAFVGAETVGAQDLLRPVAAGTAGVLMGVGVAAKKGIKAVFVVAGLALLGLTLLDSTPFVTVHWQLVMAAVEQSIDGGTDLGRTGIFLLRNSGNATLHVEGGFLAELLRASSLPAATVGGFVLGFRRG